MFYNSKKLIDEKVLQQYFFEKLMLANANDLERLIPQKYHTHYSSLSKVKGLQPEVKIKTNGERTHTTDFVLYPMDSQSPALNIEIKWIKDDFESWRYPYYDGTDGEGYVVCLNKGIDSIGLDDKISNTNIPIIYLDLDDFKKWFAINANGIISQAISNKLSIPPKRLTGEKYWVVSISQNAYDHYVNFGRNEFVWAFRNNNSPKNIMNILEGDYIIFVYFKYCIPGRKIVPYYRDENKEMVTARGSKIKSRDIDWAIGLADIYKINRGYHLNFGNQRLYSGFESADWNKDPKANTKEYTQFITFCHNNCHRDSFQYYWDIDSSKEMQRKLFLEDNKALCEITSAFSQSLNTRGDAIEISHSAFLGFIQLLQS